MKMVQRAINDSLLYGLGMFLVRLGAFLSTAVYVRVFSTETFVLLTTVLILLPLSRTVISLEIGQAAVIFAQRDSTSASFYYWHGLVFTLMSTSLVLCGLWVGFNHYLNMDYALYCLIIALIIDALFAYILNLLRWESQTFWYSLLNLGSAFLELLSILILLICFHFGVEAVFVSWAVIKGLCILIFLQRQHFFRPQLIHLKALGRMVAYSWPLAVNSLPSTLYLVADRSILGTMRTASEVALFSVGMTFAGIIGIALGGVTTALSPLIYQHASQTSTSSEIARLFEWILGGCLLLPVLFMLFNNDAVALVLPADYAAFYTDRPWVSVMMLSNIMLYLPVFSPGFYLKNKTYFTPIISFLGLLFNVGIIFPFCYWYGIYGVIWGALLANSLLAYMYIRWSQRYYAVPFCWWKIALIVIVSGFCFLLGFSINWHTHPWQFSSSIFKSVLLIMTLFGVSWIYLRKFSHLL